MPAARPVNVASPARVVITTSPATPTYMATAGLIDSFVGVVRGDAGHADE
jgi:hypothetical protein